MIGETKILELVDCHDELHNIVKFIAYIHLLDKIYYIVEIYHFQSNHYPDESYKTNQVHHHNGINHLDEKYYFVAPNSS